MTWSAAQYSRFEAQRTRPVRDLVAAIPRESAACAVDLGCGPGNSTEVLAVRFPDARITGLDNAQDMIEAARRRLPGRQFALADIGQWQADEPVDVILANASLQWLPAHQTLYPRLLAQLAPGGCLAIQTPDNLDEPAHRLLREIAARGEWAGRIGEVRHEARHDAAWYYGLLQPRCSALDIWRTTYLHPLAGVDAVVDWFRSTALRPFLAPLDAAGQQRFIAQYREALAGAYPLQADGMVLLPFPRLFIVATR